MPCFTTVLLAAAATATTRPAADGPLVAHARYVHDETNVDRVLDEPACPLVLVRNKTDEKARFETEARVLYDRHAIYIGIHCCEPDMDRLKIDTTVPGNLDIWKDDSVEIFFDPGQTRSRYIQIMVNAASKATIGFNGIYEPLNAAQWKINHEPDAWGLRIKIPFQTLRAQPYTGDQWGFNLCRTRYAHKPGDVSEHQGWNATRSGYRKPHLFGTLVFGERHHPSETRPGEEGEVVTRQRRTAIITRHVLKGPRWSPEDVSEEERAARDARLLRLLSRITRLGEPVLIGAAVPISDQPVFPWTVPTVDSLDPIITARACPDEFEPATFNLFATRDLEEVTVEIEPLLSAKGDRLDPSCVDVLQVLCWYQSGWPHVSRDRRTLVPELLIKDGTLIEVDPETRQNRLSFQGYPQDSPTLRPFDLPAFETRQIWLTFHPPADSAPGQYRSRVVIREKGSPVADAPIRLTVYPFKLSPSILDYSLYYRLRPSKTADPVGTMKRMANEIRNQIEHGINMPSTYIGSERLRPGGPPRETLEALTRIYRDLGLKDHPLILVTTAVGRQSEPDQLERIRKMVRDLVAWAKPRGYSDVYLQGIDEGNLETLRQERPSFQAVNDAGGKVFVACGADYFDTIGDILNMPIISGSLRPDVARRTRAAGHRPFSYGNPQAGIELPATYRRYYGLKLWVAGYAGGFDYEYQTHHPDHAYDDFAQKSWRNHTMAYPTLSGKPIDTRQWEGWREGVDDVRYLSTLLDALAAADKAGRHNQLVEQTRQWLRTITGDEDLDAWRNEVVRRIMALRS